MELKKTINDLVDKKILKLIPVNKTKIIESKYANKFYEVNNEKINILIINFKDNANLNDIILKKYTSKPDIIIINFNNDDKNILNILSIPVYPIIYNDVIYITPILIEQINGFSSFFLKKKSCLDDFYNRIYYTIGALICDDNFIINISTPDYSGIKDTRILFPKENIVSKIDLWMTRFVPTCNFGNFDIYNRLVIDYIFENYKINNIAEIGIYLGKTTKYISDKNRKTYYYCFDTFDNLFLENNIDSKLEVYNSNFFYKYINFETFHSNLKNHTNLFSIKTDSYLSIKFLIKHKIKIDLFYINSYNNESNLGNFIDIIFENYPEVIIILGDNSLDLTYSIDFLSEKFNIIKINKCYICTHLKRIINKDILKKEYNIITKKLEETNIDKILKYENYYKFNFIKKEIEDKKNIKKIINYIKLIDINPNKLTDFNNNNLYHIIIKLFKKTNETYYIDLYNKLIEIYKDEHIKNDANITPLEFKLFVNYFDL